MPSGRLNWSVEANPLSRVISRVRSGPLPYCDLTRTNPTAVELRYPHEEIAAALKRIAEFTYNPDPRGLISAREEIAARCTTKGVSVSPHQILLTSSTSEAYAFLFKLLCDVGDEVLVPSPSYPLFDYLMSLDSVRAQPYWVAYDGGWFIDFDDLERRINQRTRAIIVVSPNNPTGHYLKAYEAERLSALAAGAGVAIICDEVFVDYPLREIVPPVPTHGFASEVPAFILNGLSKGSGMPQMKLAWIIANNQSRMALEALELISDTYLSVNTPVQLALGDLLRVGDQIRSLIRERLATNIAAVNHLLRGSPIHALDAEGGWSVILQLPQTRSEDDWCLTLLKEHRIITQPGYFFDMPREPYLVLSLLSPTSELIDGVSGILQTVDNCS